MSEYQYYEWLAIDRPLTEKEQAEVDALSSHIDVSPTRAVVTYQWGDFKHDPLKVLARYFDAFMYYANWGSQQLAFRFPKKLLNEAQIQPYLWEDEVRLEPAGEYLILAVEPQSEDGYEEVDYEASLATMSRLRDDILHGDYRGLYLAWLVGAGSWIIEDEDDDKDEDGDEDEEPDEPDDSESSDLEDEIEPPVPAGLKDLSAALSAFIRFFDLDPYLLQAAAQASPGLKARPAVAVEETLARLSPAERDDFLLRLARGEPHLSLTLNSRLRELAGRREPDRGSEPRRTWRQLQGAAGKLRAEAERRAREAEEARRAREQAEAAARHRQFLEALAKREPAVWGDVETLIKKKTPAAYEQAATLLANLREIAVRDSRLPDFQARLEQLESQYSNRPALLVRLRPLR